MTQSAAEKEIAHLKYVENIYKDKVESSTEELNTWMARVETEKTRVAEVGKYLQVLLRRG